MSSSQTEKLDRRCGTCRHWSHYECHFPMPTVDPFASCPVPFPDAATVTYSCMTWNRGVGCKCWEVSE